MSKSQRKGRPESHLTNRGGGGTVGASISRFLGLWYLKLLDLSVCFNEESKVTGPQSFFEP